MASMTFSALDTQRSAAALAVERCRKGRFAAFTLISGLGHESIGVTREEYEAWSGEWEETLRKAEVKKKTAGTIVLITYSPYYRQYGVVVGPAPDVVGSVNVFVSSIGKAVPIPMEDVHTKEILSISYDWNPDEETVLRSNEVTI